jgi:hypothetical protein
MAVDFWADKYWNGQYFNVQYFGTGEADLNAMSGSASGSATVTGTLTGVSEQPPSQGAIFGGGAFRLSDDDVLRIQRALFPEDKKRLKRKKKQIVKLEKLATEILNEFRPIDLPPYDMALVRRAVEALDMPVKVIRERPRVVVEALLAEAQRLALEEDDEEIIALLMAA